MDNGTNEIPLTSLGATTETVASSPAPYSPPSHATETAPSETTCNSSHNEPAAFESNGDPDTLTSTQITPESSILLAMAATDSQNAISPVLAVGELGSSTSPPATDNEFAPDASLPITNSGTASDASPPGTIDSGLSSDVSSPATDGEPGSDVSPLATGSGSESVSPPVADNRPSSDTSLLVRSPGPDTLPLPTDGDAEPNPSSSLAATEPVPDTSPSTPCITPCAPETLTMQAGSGCHEPTTISDMPSFLGEKSQAHIEGELEVCPSGMELASQRTCGTSTTSVPNALPASVISQSRQPVMLLDLNMHAGRNPSRPVIPPKYSARVNVDKMTKQLKKEAKDRAHKALMEAVQECIACREKDIIDLAEVHDKTEEYIRRLLNDETHYHQKRDLNLHNVKVHWKSKELNGNRLPGCRATLQEILKAVEDDPTLGDDISEKRRDELLEELKEHRELNTKGARVDNRAANHDYQHTVLEINQTMTSLSLRTGAIGFGLFTRGHINNSIFASWSTTNGGGEFILESFGMTLGELGHKFDAWAVAQSQEEEKPTTIGDLQSECARIILEGLREKLNKPSIHMSYANYDTDIRFIHHVQLRGWPASVKFAPPATITAKPDVLLLLDALKEGECIWVSMTMQEINDLKAMLKNGAQRKPRATRKDKGGTHKMQKRKRNDENENPNPDVRPTKKARGRGKKAQLPPQRPVTPLPVESSDSDSD